MTRAIRARTVARALVLAAAIGGVASGCSRWPAPMPAKPTGAQVAQVQVGQTRDDVRRLLGPPVSTMVLARLQQEVWTYKYYDVTAPRPHMELYVYFEPMGQTVLRTEAGTDKDFDPGGSGGRN
jgi:outer membrane protein assembly factor BamE (lipoprotein component of BamABCDE complex)